ncbi:uncharacterized protein LOC121836535, partial [Ixodes scapularis]
MLSDKEGCFVVIPYGSLSEKAHIAIQKNFRETHKPGIPSCTIVSERN